MRCIIPSILLSVLYAASAQAQPQQACTEIGCLDGLTISTSLDYVWKPGKYNFDFLIDGRAVKCTGALPLKPCETHSITCSEEGVMITESGCALPADAQGFGDIMLGSGPRTIKLTITRDGESIAAGNWAPKYQTSQPNGPACGPVCRQATVKLDLR